MNVLFIGDIVGPDALEWVANRIPTLRHDLGLDVVIANAENSFISGPHPYTGFGMNRAGAERLFAAGVDIITGGNHSWDTPECADALTMDRVLRPHNVPASRTGTGIITIPVGDEQLTVVNLADTHAIPDASPAWDAFQQLDTPGTVIVDFHGGDVMQKLGFGWALSGRVAAVLGTHTHEPTATLTLTPGGTAIVVDVGMTGPSQGWQGIDPNILTATFLGQETTAFQPFTLATGPMELGAVTLQIENGRTTRIQRVA